MAADDAPTEGGLRLRSARVYLTLAVVTAATLFVEIVITRVFSLTLWYHFGFVAISLAMMGMAGGAMCVYLRRERYTAERSIAEMARLTVLFAVSVTAAYIMNLGIAFTPSFHPASLVSLVLIVGSWGVPFFLSGMVVSIALTRVPLPVGKLYAADLVGAAAGCLAVQPALAHFGPPASLAGAGVLLILAARYAARAAGQDPSEPALRSNGALVTLAAFALVAGAYPGLFEPKWCKGKWDHPYEKSFWNAISRVAIWAPEVKDDLEDGSRAPMSQYPPVTVRAAETDAFIKTWFVGYNGKPEDFGWVAWRLTNIANHLRTGRMAVIGSGGGIDVQAALVMGQQQVTGIELNPVLNALLRQDYAAFTGDIAHDPRVRLVTDEARNWIERSGEKFDVIQTSFIDTQAATAAGAFALAENTLYTDEAWSTYLRHLTPHGLFGVIRWHWYADPMETYRLVTLARAAVGRAGADDPGRCVAVLAEGLGGDLGKCMVLVSPSALSDADCRKLDELCRTYGFELLYSPTSPKEPYASLLDPQRGPQWESSYHLNIAPPTDDQAYFFFMVRLRDMLSPHRFRQIWSSTAWPLHMCVLAMFTLLFLGVSLAAGAVALTLVPLYRREGRGLWRRGDLSGALYFAAIGVGFMLVEMGVMQRTGIALGHPLYGLQVTLFSLLLGSGVGSLLSASLKGSLRRQARGLLLATAAMATGIALAVGPVCVRLAGAPQMTRLVTVGALVAVVGLFMGTAFPVGLTVARVRGREDILPWLWGVNGVCSVLGAFAGTAVGIVAGAQATMLAGAVAYVLANVALWRQTAGLEEAPVDADG